MEYRGIKREIIDTCLWLERNKPVIGAWGNVSVRADKDVIILTP